MSDHPRGRLAGWILLALAGLALAVALSITASNLSTQPIGLSGEPLRAGEKLAPPSVTRTHTTTAAKKSKPKRTTPTTTAPAPSSTSGPGAGDNDSDDHGSGRHHDGDDD